MLRSVVQVDGCLRLARRSTATHSLDCAFNRRATKTHRMDRALSRALTSMPKGKVVEGEGSCAPSLTLFYFLLFRIDICIWTAQSRTTSHARSLDSVLKRFAGGHVSVSSLTDLEFTIPGRRLARRDSDNRTESDRRTRCR